MFQKNNFRAFHSPSLCLHSSSIIVVFLPVTLSSLFMAPNSLFNISSLQRFLAACGHCGGYH